ncbi:putative protein WVD2-like 7 [Helianthus annuus]|nr:putative protein WVD2-like 7 [Helianthus annuus]
MAGQIEEPLRFNFQADLLHSGSISFGRFESESLSWERRSSFSHNRYLEEVEKYSKPGTVTEKKAYFEAHFKRKALLKQSSSENQDRREVTTSENDDMHDLQESESGNESKHFTCFDESPHSSGHFSYDKETEIQICVNQNVETLCAENTNLSSVDHPMTGHDHVKLEETHAIGTENVDLVKREEVPEVTLNDSVIMVDVASEKPKLKARVKLAQVSRTVSSDASRVSAKTKIREIKTLPMKEKVKKSPRPASSIAHSGRRTLKPEESSTSFPKAKLPPPNRSIVKEYRPEKSLPGGRETVNRTKQNNHPPSKSQANHIAGGFTFKSDQRAERRKEEKKAVAEISKSLNFKATPMPSFYKESARSLDQNKAISSNNKTPNRPRTDSMAPSTKRVPSNSASSYMAPGTKRVPSNSASSSIPRPGSSTSVTSKYRRPEPFRTIQEKKKDLNLPKQKGHEAIIGARVRETKRIHTGAGIKPGYLAVRVAT